MASKHYHIKLNFDSDRDVIDRIESKENKNDYIRRLVLSDIAADYLQGMIKVEDSAEHQQKDFEYHARINWFNEHCPAVGDPDYDCTGCFYFQHHKDDPYSDAGYCNAPYYFEKDMEAIKVYIKEGGALRDYPAEFKGLKKAALNSFYGKMIKDPFKDSVIDNMLEDKKDG